MSVTQNIKDQDFVSIRQAIAKLGSLKFGPTSTPTFAGLTLTGLTASRLVATNGSQALASVSDLTSWIAGTTNQITSTSDGDGTLTLSTPQNIHTGASPTFAGLTLSGVTSGILWSNSGVVTGDATLDQIGNLAANKTFNNAAYSISFNFTNPTNQPTYDGAFEIQASGAFAGDLLHVHQHTGNPGTTDLCHFEATDNDVTVLRLQHDGTGNVLEIGASGSAVGSIDESGNAVLNDLSITTPSDIYNLSHDSFADFVANEHIDHTSVTLTAGAGLTGGGDISANRSFALSHLGIESLTDPNADRILFWDDDGNATGWLVPNTGLAISTTNLNVTADYSVITANDGSTDVTSAELEELSDGSVSDLHGHYHDRGNLSSADFHETGSKAVINTDGSHHDLDLSGIIPAGTVRVKLRVLVLDDAANSYIFFKDPDHADDYSTQGWYTPAANIAVTGAIDVGVDSNRYVDYIAANLAFTQIDINVLGWWLV